MTPLRGVEITSTKPRWKRLFVYFFSFVWFPYVAMHCSYCRVTAYNLQNTHILQIVSQNLVLLNYYKPVITNGHEFCIPLYFILSLQIFFIDFSFSAENKRIT